jgi:hypothetical protein
MCFGGPQRTRRNARSQISEEHAFACAPFRADDGDRAGCDPRPPKPIDILWLNLIGGQMLSRLPDLRQVRNAEHLLAAIDHTQR